MATTLSTLMDMLSYCRPHGSLTERQFIKRFIQPLPGAYVDHHCNWHVVTNPASTVLWSCHTDTVHRTDGRQTLHYDSVTGLLGLSRKSKARERNCLGADDTVGCYLMIEMIRANVPGHYIFHYAEEKGGIGSTAYARTHAEDLRRFTCAIALDRGGFDDIITHQYGSRTCSDAFATALGAALHPTFAPCHGVYTDTAEYAALIPECTNLSVGYERAHSANETVHIPYVEWLLAHLLTLDVSALPIVREAKEDEPYVYTFDRWDDWRTSSTPLAVVEHVSSDSPYADYTFEELEAMLAHAELMEQWAECRALEEEMWERLDAVEDIDGGIDTIDSYLDPDYADIQRALLKHRTN